MAEERDGEWDVDHLDLAAYLRRVGWEGGTEPTVETLVGLHRAHLAAIPFENVDVLIGRGVAVDLDSVQAKLVERRRGGYCYEHGTLFAAVLERLGYPVERTLARIGGHQPRPMPRTHMNLRVTAGDRVWLADTGFGSGLLEPLAFDVAGPRAQGPWTFELVRTAAAGPTGTDAWELRELVGGEWATHYGLDRVRQHPADVMLSNHFTSTFPRSPFVNRLVVARKDADALHRLTDRVYAVTRPGRPAEERAVDDAELADLLTGLFRVPLDRDELAQLTARLPDPAR
ncbi:MAG: arylamine N-acetyltransferase family protein [Mycobacteriales bacterium]